MILILNSSIAVGLAVILSIGILKKKFVTSDIKKRVAITIGLVLWLFANVQWVIYENDEIVPSVPSNADYLWLFAYPFFGYYLYVSCKEAYIKYPNKKVIVISIGGGTIFLTLIISLTLSFSNFSTYNGTAILSIIMIYPILNTILIVPAMIVFLGLRKKSQHSLPIMCESLSLISLIIADSWFVIIFVSHSVESIWYSNLFIIDHYLVISAGLLWYMKFLIFSNNKHYLTFTHCFKFHNPIPKRFLLTALLTFGITFSSILIVSLLYSNGEAISLENNKDIRIGALLGLSGISAERGKSQEVALNIAEDDINNNFSKSKINKKIKVTTEDTQRNPDVAVAKLKILIDKDIRIIIGPSTSSELKAIKKYIDESNLDVILISHSSTSPSLSINDNIFRFVQNDNNQGKEIANKMLQDKIKVIVPIWRNDTYGNELFNSTKFYFEEGSGIITEGINYKPHKGKFAASLHRTNFIMWNKELEKLNMIVSEAVTQYGNKSVGIYIISYDEIIPILIQSQHYRMLGNVSWYGSDGSAMNERLLKHEEAAEFANKTKFLNPLRSMDVENKEFESLEDNMTNKIGKEPDSYDANIYDALWLAALLENGLEQNNTKTLKEIASSYSGTTGKIMFDEFGDRIGTYDFWTVMKNITTNDYTWEKLN
ncbi:MAG: ABC transporter substrate-binding protein [Nitrososphaeraceae archaeon]